MPVFLVELSEGEYDTPEMLRAFSLRSDADAWIAQQPVSRRVSPDFDVWNPLEYFVTEVKLDDEP